MLLKAKDARSLIDISGVHLLLQACASFRFVGYGTAAQGATFTRIATTNQWQINSADGLVHDIITLSNNASVHASDFVFV